MTRPVVMLTNAIVEDKQGGLYRYVSELAATLARRGVDVTVLTKKVTDDAPEVEITGSGVRIERYEVPAKSGRLFALLYPFVVFRAVLRGLRRHRSAVVHAHFPVPALVPLLTRRPYLYTFHAPVYRELLGERQHSYVLPRPAQGAAVAGLRMVEARLLRRARRVILLSEFTRGELAILDRGAAGRARLCPGGVDVDRFSPAEVEDADERGWPLIVVARRLVWRTGVVEAVDAMEHVVRTFPRAHLVVLGNGLLRPVIEERVRQSGTAERVSLLGYVSDDELVAWYRRATMVLMPTQELEGFGLASAEAMACGTPVVATPVGANAEVVGTFDDAWMATASDARAIGDAVVAVAKEIANGRWPRAQVREHVAPRFGWDAVADVHLRLYAEANQ